MVDAITVRHLFIYADGELRWRKSRGSSRAGKRAGTFDTVGYRSILIDRKQYKEHRLVYIYHHGYAPDTIDHVDGNPLNNKIENLREATTIQNGQNSKLSKSNTSGVKNVSWCKQRNKWMVFMSINKKRTHFGFYDDLELAELVAIEARTKHHGVFANHGSEKRNHGG